MSIGGVNLSASMPAQEHDATAEACSAEERILADLVNALLAENVWGTAEAFTDLRQAAFEIPGWRTADTDLVCCQWRIDKEGGHFLAVPVRSAIVQAYRYAGGGVFEVKADLPEKAVRLGPVELLQRLTDSLYAGARKEETASAGGFSEAGEGPARLLQLLRLSLEQTRWTEGYAKRSRQSGLQREDGAERGHGSRLERMWSIIELERRASLRDRPFHPVAKAKGGWTQTEYEAYSAESGLPIRLRWLAVRRSRLISGSGAQDPAGSPFQAPAELLLTPGDRRRVEEAMARLGLAQDEYMALPAHPWQAEAVLPGMLPEELAEGVFVPLEVEAGEYYATSSARSLAPADGGAQHVKLPLGIVSLGAVRYLPAVHMMNAERGQRLLEQARERDPELRRLLSLCDETKWWAYLPVSGDLFADPPRHLSAMIRSYPSGLIGTDGIRLVPMSALAVHGPDHDDHLFDLWLQERGLDASGAAELFREVCLGFFHIILRLFRFGLVPEIHGQNAVLVVRQGEVTGLLLRDHDSVRLHLPWMEKHGIPDPHYKMKPGYPNSLYNETPEKLLVYIQTLGIQVNLYSILESVAGRYQEEESALWHVLKESLSEAILLAELPSEVADLVRRTLFDNPSWPWKHIMKPLLEQTGSPSGSMPSGMGTAVNPFHRCSRVCTDEA
ncbi:IucA/IucC family protein [Paenibacillus chartarius]|uniref:IucA/IucC family protein n=1 Tax=Paenibacillus chartarius TaxID=747481 RepID=A0ABV6DT36_9BACL